MDIIPECGPFRRLVQTPPSAPAVVDVSLTSSVFEGGCQMCASKVVRHLTHKVEDRVTHEDGQMLNVAHCVQHIFNALNCC